MNSGRKFVLSYIPKDWYTCTGVMQCDTRLISIFFYLNYVLGEAWFFMIIIVQIIWANEMVQLPFGFSE